MTPHRYLQCLEILRLSQRSLAPILGCSLRLPQVWGTTRDTIPPKVAEWLEDCVAMRRRFPDPPPPDDWRRKTGPKPPPPKKRQRGRPTSGRKSIVPF